MINSNLTLFRVNFVVSDVFFCPLINSNLTLFRANFAVSDEFPPPQYFHAYE